MEHRYWQDKWAAQDIRFHKNTANPNLERYGALLPPGGTFVPLCGKSLDLKWLADQGHAVVGAELSELACDAFFRENKLEAIRAAQAPFTVFRNDNITLWCGDFFALPVEAMAGVTSVYDRASLVALPPDLRVAYAQKLKSLFSATPELTYLLVTFEYDQALAAGPPFSVPEKEVRELFSSEFKVELLDRHDEGELRAQEKFRTAPTLSECVYRLTKGG